VNGDQEGRDEGKGEDGNRDHGEALRDRRFSLALQGGLAILSCFTPERPVLGTTELAGMLGMSVATTHRLILTLADEGYLEQERDSRSYRLTLRATELGMASINEMGLCKHARPHLQALAKSSGYTVALGVLDGAEVLLVDLLAGTAKGQRERAGELKVGSSLPTHCTALGKVLLANLPARRRRALIAEIEPELHAPPTPRTLATEPLLRAALARVRATEIATNQEEWCAGACAIAAPVRDESGEVVAAVSVVALGGAIEVEELSDLVAKQLLSAAQRISARLGWTEAGE
jgi:IclR family pca regulon transcriptional regulator